MAETIDEMSSQEQDATERWFQESHSALTALTVIIDGEIADAVPGAEGSDDLLALKGKVLDDEAMLDRAEEEVFTEKTRALEPPTDAQILKTKQAAQALGRKIAQEKASEAVVHLADDFAGLLSKVLA